MNIDKKYIQRDSGMRRKKKPTKNRNHTIDNKTNDLTKTKQFFFADNSILKGAEGVKARTKTKYIH